MELKTNYQYTYFIHPFVIKDGKYQKYILKMLEDKNCNLKIFQKEKDLKLYQYFLPKTREFLFSSFRYGDIEKKKIENLSPKKQAVILSKKPCIIFEYTLNQDIQGKVEEKSGIFFTIRKIEIICFSTGICFLAIKTNLEDYASFNNVLNFNYKFKDINNKLANLESYDNIRIQTESYADTKTFQEFIYNITGENEKDKNLDIDMERFLTYSYACIDQEAWNETNSFENLKHQFIKYSELLSADSSRDYEYEKLNVFSKWKYVKIGLNKQSIMLFSSSTDMNNYTLLPEEYENQYFYTYILNLYKKIYLKKLENELKKSTKTRKEFIEFTKSLWLQEITEDETGSLFNNKIQEILEIDKLYNQIKEKYDVLYKELNIEKEKKSTIIIFVILIISLIINIINFITLFK